MAYKPAPIKAYWQIVSFDAVRMSCDPTRPKRTLVRTAQIVALYIGNWELLYSPAISGTVIGKFPTENIKNPEQKSVRMKVF